ncbi:hypothetical protein B0I37DRAFT_383899 [Chaetomium sp. MPI-CAGE-AT-0009]|nr:hypothetical protein B0I37DRAFT_383899 [Chaetomium sp. MPI-CAGE-AT-0009]
MRHSPSEHETKPPKGEQMEETLSRSPVLILLLFCLRTSVPKLQAGAGWLQDAVRYDVRSRSIARLGTAEVGDKVGWRLTGCKCSTGQKGKNQENELGGSCTLREEEAGAMMKAWERQSRLVMMMMMARAGALGRSREPIWTADLQCVVLPWITPSGGRQAVVRMGGDLEDNTVYSSNDGLCWVSSVGCLMMARGRRQSNFRQRWLAGGDASAMVSEMLRWTSRCLMSDHLVGGCFGGIPVPASAKRVRQGWHGPRRNTLDKVGWYGDG